VSEVIYSGWFGSQWFARGWFGPDWFGEFEIAGGSGGAGEEDHSLIYRARDIRAAIMRDDQEMFDLMLLMLEAGTHGVFA
jgi:hypothetical protein